MNDNSNETKIRRERDFHNIRFGGDDPRKNVSKFYAVKVHANNYFNEKVLSHCRGKRLLEIGCGFGNMSLQWLAGEAKLTGIDISESGIERSIEVVEKNGYSAEFKVMNAERMDFSDESFDLAVGSGILHHLDVDKSLSELARLLVADGQVYFIEPLGHNPLINLYRRLTPAMRTEDEHPLRRSDFKLFSRYFDEITISYFSLATLFAVPFVNTFIFNRLYSLLQRVDSLLLKIPFVQQQAWTAIICLAKPIKAK